MGLFSGLKKIVGVAKSVGNIWSAATTGDPISSFFNTIDAVGNLGQGQDAANRANSAAAQRQMDFQQYNSDTAIYRRVQDLVRSGLNPMLAYSDAASSPSGAMAVNQSVDNASADASMKRAQSQSSSAAAKQALAQVENISTQSDLNRALVLKAGADTANSTASAANQSAQAAQARINTVAKAAELPGIRANADVNVSNAKVDSSAWSRIWRGAGNAVKNISPFISR